jgi:hypothetical protein
MKYPRQICAIGALLFILCVCAIGQTLTGTLVGTVTDSSGGTIGGAKITITETNTNVSRSTQTNSSGNYIFPNLPPGNYTVTFEQPGFKKESRADVQVLVNTNPRVDVTLQPGQVSEQIEVTAAAPPIQSDTASVGVQIQSTTVSSAPLGTNRNFQSLLNLVPGTTPATFQHSQFFNAASSLQTEVNGQLRMGNNYMIEGTDDNERTGLLQILIPPVEAIQTVDVGVSNQDPEMGRASGAIVNVLLKSGANDFHGSAYEFFQNNKLNARAFFNPSVGHLAYNYVGGNIGGPIKKNKLFFFGDYLRVMDHEANTNLLTIPPSIWRNGNLASASTTVYDPATGNPVDGTNRTPFSGNVIPTNRINSISSAILNGLPGSNQGSAAATSNNYFGLLPFQKTTDSLDTKIDDNVTDKDRLSGRFSFARPIIFQAPVFGNFGGPAQGAFEGTGTQKTYSAGLNYDRIMSATLVSELRIAVSHYHNQATPTDYGKNDAEALGIPGVNINPFTSGMVGIQINDGFSNPLTGYSASLPWIRAEANVDIVNTWTKTIGNHTIKWGGDLKRVRDDLLQDQTFSPRGIYYFGANQTALYVKNNPSTTGIANDFASFLLDMPYEIGRDVNTYFPAYRQWELFGYVGDKWQVSSKLTLSLGLRWEFYPPAVPEFAGGFSNYDASNNTLVVAGVGSNPSNLGIKTRYNYFAPRLGLAYRLDEKTVIRAGYGTSFTPFPDNTYAYNYPVRSNNQYTNVGNGYADTYLPSGQPATFQNGFPLPVPVAIPSNGIIQANTSNLLAQNMVTIDKNFKNPYVESWNFAIQRAIPLGFTIDAAYVGSHGVDTVATYNLNTNLTTLGGGSAGQPLNQAFGKTAGATLYFAGFSSSYQSLQMKLDRKLSSGLFMTTAFTWGKALGYQSGDDGGLTFYIDQRRNYARVDFDREFVYSQSFNYKLPFGSTQHYLHSGPASWVLGGWQLSGIISLSSGTPMTFGANGGSLNTPGETQTADQVSPVQILGGINVGNPWFSKGSFVQPTGVRFGTSGRNILSGPGLFALNLSLAKSFRITERFKAEIRADSFNLTNTPQFANPSTSITSSTYGYVTGTLGSGTGVNGTGGGRVFQLGAKINF